MFQEINKIYETFISMLSGIKLNVERNEIIAKLNTEDFETVLT